MLTVRQAQILEYLCNFPYSYAPSVREIGKAVGLRSSGTVHGHLNNLEQMGYIERLPNQPRCITVKKHAPVESMTALKRNKKHNKIYKNTYI
ncbi:LexA family protein [Anaerospora hongkongensis]|uniref:LexA family protein n=1 Tax=Anaerospora hongkongensis TaxID=244830 RepID=UPI0028A0849B|nr:MarR family transcriptional regulator [Anaerospora hongkongensis]